MASGSARMKRLDIRKVYDGGFEILLRMFGRKFYFRRRGRSNGMKPKYIFDMVRGDAT